MKKLITGVLIIALLIIAVACAQAPTPVPAPVPTSTPAPTTVTRPAPMPPGASGGFSGAPPPIITIPDANYGTVVTSAAEQPFAADRMIVRTGSMYLVVNDVLVALNNIAGLAGSLDGYVVSSNSWQEDDRLAGAITIRVVADRFDDGMRTLRSFAVEVTSESTSSTDVTEEYTDLSAKLRNLEASEEQLLKLMEKAEKVEDILNIQRELTRTRGEIEQTKGRMQYLERTSETSLIEVHLQQASIGVRFTADRRTIKEGQSVRFDPQISGGFGPYSYEWDFGDGETSTGSNPIHAYKASGSYTVSLKVTDDRSNTDAETRSDYITVLPGWSAGITASGAWNGLVIFAQGLANVLIWVGIFSPVWIVIGGILYWWFRRRKQKASAKS